MAPSVAETSICEVVVSLVNLVLVIIIIVQRDITIRGLFGSVGNRLALCTLDLGEIGAV